MNLIPLDVPALRRAAEGKAELDAVSIPAGNLRCLLTIAELWHERLPSKVSGFDREKHLDDQEISNAEAVCADATPGPWRFGGEAFLTVRDNDNREVIPYHPNLSANGAFIALARTAFPRALATIRFWREKAASAMSAGNRAREGLADVYARLRHTQAWYASRLKLLRLLARDHGFETAHCHIVANGTAGPQEPPTSEQQASLLAYRAETAEAERDKLKELVERVVAEWDSWPNKNDLTSMPGDLLNALREAVRQI